MFQNISKVSDLGSSDPSSVPCVLYFYDHSDIHLFINTIKVSGRITA